jgi:hypothetical protein
MFHFYYYQQTTDVIRVLFDTHNYEIYYLSAVNYAPLTKGDLKFSLGLIFIHGQWWETYNSFLTPFFISWSLFCIYPVAFPYNIFRGHYGINPGGPGRGLTANFSTHQFYQGHYLPGSLNPTILAEVTITLQDLLPCFGLYQSHFSH